VENLDAKGIVTKRRDTKVRKYNGGTPFIYGPLAHFLKNRLYIGETGHKDKWFPGEHAAIVDRKTFDQVQQLLASKSAGRKAHRTASQAVLVGKLYDDRGNRMSRASRPRMVFDTVSTSARLSCEDERRKLGPSEESRQRLSKSASFKRCEMLSQQIHQSTTRRLSIATCSGWPERSYHLVSISLRARRGRRSARCSNSVTVVPNSPFINRTRQTGTLG
jgi:hypothetical protein